MDKKIGKKQNGNREKSQLKIAIKWIKKMVKNRMEIEKKLAKNSNKMDKKMVKNRMEIEEKLV